MELKDYWVTIRRRWRWVVASVIGALAVAALLTWTATPQYASTSRLFVSTSESDSSSAYTGNLFATQRVTSYADLVTSRSLADRVADVLDEEELTADALMSQVSATVVPETVILEITATDPDPALARAIAQAYGEELTELVDDLETPNGKTEAPIKATVIDDAVESDSPVSPQPLRNLVLGGVLGLLLGLGIAVARELLDNSVTSTEDVAEVTDAPILGTIYTDTAAKDLPEQALSNASPWSEAFRVLRTNMQYVEVDHDQKVVVLTSSLPAEGKTTTAIGLALTMAMADQRVALVECDLRRPLIAQRLDLDGAVGTTSVLIGRVDLDDALQPYGTSGLHVLACGPIPPNPSELLQSQAMEKLLIDLRSRFDVVILDAPPLLPVTDAALLATQTDGAVVVARHGKTTHDQLEHALERLESVDAKALGVIINMAPARKTGGRYGYGYGYGYGAEAGGTKRAAREAKEMAKVRGKHV